jgi:hypothetical protein
MAQVEMVSYLKSHRMEKLFLGLFFDGLGMLSFTVPFVGEFSDVVWAPIAGFLLARMYKGTIGKVGGVIAFVEEFLPFTDFIPTFTLTWIYTYLIKKER